MQKTAERAGQETRGVLAGQGERGQTAGSFIKMTFPPVTDSKLQHNSPSLDASFCVSQSNSAELQLETSTSDPRGFDVGRFIADRRNQSQAAASISHHLSLQTAPGHLLAGILNYTGVRGHQLETVVAVGVTVSFTS